MECEAVSRMQRSEKAKLIKRRSNIEKSFSIMYVKKYGKK